MKLSVAAFVVLAAAAAAPANASVASSSSSDDFTCNVNSTRERLYRTRKVRPVTPVTSPKFSPKYEQPTPPLEEDETDYPTKAPVTKKPTKGPTFYPSYGPTSSPSVPPTSGPTVGPSDSPTLSPTNLDPTRSPTVAPVRATPAPSANDRIQLITMAPTSAAPTMAPVAEAPAPPVYLKCPTQSPVMHNDTKLCNSGEALECNVNLANAPCNAKLSNMNFAAGEPAVIPCGQCVKVDTTDGSELDFAHGIRVEGKLYFPSTAHVFVKTKFIIVQGILKMDPPQKNVTIHLYDDEQVLFKVDEDGNPEIKVDNQIHDPCNIGSKAIAVVGGQLDVQGNNANCPAWEKLQGLGQGIQRPFHMPCDNSGENCMELELAGECAESTGHTEGLGRYTVRCPLVQTATIRQGEWNAFTFTSVEPKDPAPFVYPQDDDGNTLELKMKSGCGMSGWHTDHFGKCTMYCNLFDTAEIRSNDYFAMTFTSRAPPTDTPWTAPYDDTGKQLSLQVKWGCGYSSWHIENRNDYIFYCSLEPTADIRDGDQPVRLTNAETGAYIDAPLGIKHWAHGGGSLWFYSPDSSEEDVKAAFPRGAKISVEYHNSVPDGQSVDIAGVHHWTWSGRTMFFFPTDPSIETCEATAKAFNSKFPNSYSIDVSYRKYMPVPAGQQVQATKGTLHWAWDGNSLYFHPDVTAEEFTAKFPVGYRMKVEYTHLQDMYEIEVSSPAARCWGAKPGMQLLLTSHTWYDYDEQLVTVKSVAGNIITLQDKIVIPVTMQDSSDFAVEIASLNRPIVFEAETQQDDKIGGHIIIRHTYQSQRIEGVEIKNFGQLGRIARYPINFFKAGNLTSTFLKRNVIRNSNQRGINLLQTNNVVIENNVIHNCTGHAYAMESGAERRLVFNKNLGVRIFKLDGTLTRSLSEQSCRRETDDRPAVFFITNPDSTWTFNVAAGSAQLGFWFATSHPYQEENLIKFDSNDAHSCRDAGFSTWWPGWKPKKTAVIEGLKVYRCHWNSVFIAHTYRLTCRNCVFADPRARSVWVLRADEIRFENCLFYGVSGYAPKLSWCPTEGLRGLSLHPEPMNEYDWSGSWRGVTIKDTEFKGFSFANSGCNGSQPLDFRDDQVWTRAFYSVTYFYNLKFDCPAGDQWCRFGTCDIAGMKEAIINVVSDIHKTFSSSGQVGFLASPEVQGLLPNNACQTYSNCMVMCKGQGVVCLRTVRFMTDAAYWFKGPVDMYVKDKSSGKTITISNQLRQNTTDYTGSYGTYTAALPKGNFEIKFKHRDSGELVWPGFVHTVLEAAPDSCQNYVRRGDIVVIKPGIGRGVCADNLILNSNFEDGIEGWSSWGAGFLWSFNRGMGNTKALETIRRTSHSWQGPQTYLDATCIAVGQVYDIVVHIRNVVNATGETLPCCERGEGERDCPWVQIVPQRYNVTTGKIETLHYLRVAYMDMSTYTLHGDNFNTLYGQWFVEEKHIADRYLFQIIGGTGQFIIDNVQVTKCDYTQVCKRNQIINGGMYTTRGWWGWGNPIKVVTPGAEYVGSALAAVHRNSHYRGMHNGAMRDLGCFHAGDRWRVQFQAKIWWQMDEATYYDCQPAEEGTVNCPFLRLHTMHVINGKTFHRFHEIRDMNMRWYPHYYNTFRTIVDITEDMVEGDFQLFRFMIVGGAKGSVLAVDNVIFRLIPEGEDEEEEAAPVLQQELGV